MNTTPVDATLDITEDDFWSHLHVPADEEPRAADVLAEALRLGRSGRGDDAYRTLAEYHRLARGDSWRRARDLAAQAKPLPAATKRKLLAFSGELSDLDAASLNEPLRALLFHVIRTGEKPAARFLADVLVKCERARHSLFFGRYPINGQLPAHDHFHFFWHMHLALVHAGVVEPAAVEAAMKRIMGNGRAMRQQSDKYIVHNIYSAGCYGLLFIGRTMREFADAEEWDRHALTMLDHDWDRSFFTDGGHAERNWGYGAHTLGRHIHVWNFTRETGGMHGLEDHYREGLQRAHRFYAYTLDGKDRSPCLGDEGLGELGYVLDKAVDPANKIFPADTPRHLGVDTGSSCLMRGAQVAIMRNGGAPTDAYASLNVGEYAGWHSHQDLLTFTFRALGELLLEEVPRFGPYEHPMDILWRAPEAHNQVLVDTFHYDSRPCIGEDLAWYSDERIDYVSAFHRAYRAVPPDSHRTHHQSADLIVRRTVVFVKDGGYALVLDSVRGEHTDSFNRATSQLWHSPHGFSVLAPGLARTKGRVGCLMAWARPETIRRMETSVDFSADEVVSFHRPMHDQWHQLRARTWIEGEHDGGLGFATVLVPFKGKPPAVSVRPVKLSGHVVHRAEAFEVTTPAGRDTFVLNPERMNDVMFRKRPVPGRAWIKLGNRRGEVEVSADSITGPSLGSPPVPWT